MDAIIIIDEHSKEPIYRQIIEQVRRHVATGALAPGDELPSLRQLAVDLGVHLNTIALAYRELERQGIVRLRQGSRATILAVDRSTITIDMQVIEQIRSQLERVRTQAILAGMPLIDLQQLAQVVFDNASSDPQRSDLSQEEERT